MAKRDQPDPSRSAIEESLRKVYRQTLEEDLPDRFTSLLKRLRETDAGATSEADGQDNQDNPTANEGGARQTGQDGDAR